MKISRYKFNIILWYTGLLSFILVVVFALLYTLLGFQLINEIDSDLAEKTEWIEPRLREVDDPYMDGRFYRNLISRRYDRRLDADDVFFAAKRKMTTTWFLFLQVIN